MRMGLEGVAVHCGGGRNTGCKVRWTERKGSEARYLWRRSLVGPPRSAAGTTGLVLTQGEASVELQVGGEEAGQAGKNLAAGLAPIDLIAAVDQAIGGAPIVCLVQHSTEKLPFPDDHLHRERALMPGCR
jgi:hypothetical protein